MKDYQYVKDFQNLGVGLFVHFGLYSKLGKGEWCLHLNKRLTVERYERLAQEFHVKKNWAKELVKTAKALGARYITITTRHHDGFSLYDTKGLSTYDSMQCCGRDLMGEFVAACREGGIVPFFYHTLLDWHVPEYKENFPAYIDYLVKSLEVLCTSYGEIGGFWFDGMWDKPDADWQEDRIYGTLRKYQPNAMIINNTGLSAQGKVGHSEIDSVTFERGTPTMVGDSDRPRASEMCQILNDHWGYAKNDCNYKSVKELINDLVSCRSCNCNFLLNVGLMGNGGVKPIDGCILGEIGHWIKANKSFIYKVHACDIQADNAVVVTDGEYYYAIGTNFVVGGDNNVAKAGAQTMIKVHADICNATWMDNGKRIRLKNNSFANEPFEYGVSLAVRVAKFSLKNK